MWRYVYKDFSELDKKSQLALFKAMEQDLFPKNTNKLDKYRWLELHKKLAFENRIEQMLISACQKSNYFTVAKLRTT